MTDMETHAATTAGKRLSTAAMSEMRFADFRFSPAENVLWRGKDKLRLGTRALAILGELLRSPGTIVSKRAMFNAVWPGLQVDEANLRVQISSLRRALGKHGNLVRSEPGLGYRFVGVLIEADADHPPRSRRFRVPRLTRIPIGREATAQDVVALINGNRVVTIVGAGGIGKSTIALLAATASDQNFTDGVCFVDLAQALTPDQVPRAIASALDVFVEVAPTYEEILHALAERNLLLILDSCEHLINVVAGFVENVLTNTDCTRILATSQEALRVPGEAVHQLEPLTTPPEQIHPTADSIQTYSAVQLFACVASQCAPSFKVTELNAELVSNICRRLDGVPLAIELAASVTSFVGIEEVWRGLNEQFSLIDMKSRATLPRHRTLAATFDWSYSLLSRDERSALRRLASFTGSFTLSAAIEIVVDDDMSETEARSAVVGLAQKSLLSVAAMAGTLQYRLLDSTRAFAGQAAAAEGERQGAKQRHAHYYLRLLESTDWASYDPIVDRMRFRGYMTEVQAALDWAFAAEPELGVRLTLAAERLWLELTSIAHGAHYLNLALSYLNDHADASPLLLARVQVALAAAQSFVSTPGEDSGATYEQAWEASQITGDPFDELRALHALIHHCLSTRRPCFDSIQEFEDVARRSGDDTARHFSRMYLAHALINISEIARSADIFEEFIRDVSVTDRKYDTYFTYNMKAINCTALGTMLYWQGYADRAREAYHQGIKLARQSGHPFSIFYSLAYGSVWSELWSEDLLPAADHLQKLEEIAVLYRPWQAPTKAYRAMLVRRRDGDLIEAERLLTSALQQEFNLKTGSLLPSLLVELADIRMRIGDNDGAEAVLNQILTFSTGDQDAITVAPYSFIKAQILQSRKQSGDMEAAEALLRRSIDISRSRNFFHYELEATVAMHSLLSECGRAAEGRALLGNILARQPEGRDRPRFARMHALLDRPL